MTRSRSSRSRLAALLEAEGCDVIRVPTIGFNALRDDWHQRWIGDDVTWDWCVVTSATTVRMLVERVGTETAKAARARVGTLVAVGSSTARALDAMGWGGALVPSSYDAEGLVELLRERRVKTGDRVVIPRALVARDILPDALREMGADVSVVPVYEAFSPTSSRELIVGLEEERPDMLTFASSRTVEHMNALLGDEHQWLRDVPCGCIGPVTAETARTSGYNVVVVPQEFTFDGLVAGLVAWWTANAE